MSSYKEIGGYFSLECGKEPLFYENGVYVNSARNALRYIIQAYQIKKIFLPFYTCPVVWEAVKAEGCEIVFYEVDQSFVPDLRGADEGSFIVYTDYFGVCGRIAEKLAKKYKNLIMDHAQAFYAKPLGLASFYSPRKFFGLPDGGIAILDKRIGLRLEKDISYGRCSHLLKRIDLGANAAYQDFCVNDAALENQPVKEISALSLALMGTIDYEQAKERRFGNFEVLHGALRAKNELEVELKAGEVPMVYPFLIEEDGLRAKLIENKVYVAKYWPKIEEAAPAGSPALYLQKYLLPLPIDQRYDEADMKKILEVING